MYFTPGNDFYTAAKPEVYIYLDYIDIKGGKDLCVFNFWFKRHSSLYTN